MGVLTNKDLIFILFTRWESHAKGGQADVEDSPQEEYPISGACQPLADCQGLAVANYGFAPGRLESRVSSTFAQLRY